MPANEVIPFKEDGHRLTVQANTAITGKRFIRPTANRVSGPGIPATAQVGASDPVDGGNYLFGHCGAGQKAAGVSTWDAAVGEKTGCIRHGVVPVTVGVAALAVGVEVQSDANGMAVVWDGTVAGRPNGQVMSGAAAGADAEILLYG